MKPDVFGSEECGASKKLTTVGRQPRCGAVNLFIVLQTDDNGRCGGRLTHTLSVMSRLSQVVSMLYIVIQTLISYRSQDKMGLGHC